MQTYTAPLVTTRMLVQASSRNASNPGAEAVVQDRAVLAAQLVLGRIGVIDIVGRVAERHVRELTAEHMLDICEDRGVAAQQAVVAEDPEVTRFADRVLGWLRDLVLRLVAPRPAIGDTRYGRSILLSSGSG